ncbi:hypothetical protein [Sphingomonas sp. DT-204]|uniref:hypothetical protein n=1 Tax=Sphingomonas sp. DT-204 TaxID=3396166 RepID=UPI003F1AC8CD
MNAPLVEVIAAELNAPVSAEVKAAAAALARRPGALAVLFYGSVLRTGDLDGVLDFYVLTDGIRGRGLRALATRWLWPDVSYVEIPAGARTIRAKVATMPIETFRTAVEGRSLDTTIWARFTQPAALVWAADAAVARRVVDAVAMAVTTAARFAAVLGPERGEAADYWSALFRQTYTAEFRVERPGRERQILAYHPERYVRLLPLAWDAAGIGHPRAAAGVLAPTVPPAVRRAMTRAWGARRRAGKPLNLARLVKAAFTFEGATRYALWKLERHTGVHLPLTPWRERHPILAAPGVLWRVWRGTRISPAR